MQLVATTLSGLAWALALLNIWGYGKSVRIGAIIGMLCASTFIALSMLTKDAFMLVANVAFLGLHVWNLRRANLEKALSEFTEFEKRQMERLTASLRDDRAS